MGQSRPLSAAKGVEVIDGQTEGFRLDRGPIVASGR
jgi:hypothetical protein